MKKRARDLAALGAHVMSTRELLKLVAQMTPMLSPQSTRSRSSGRRAMPRFVR